MARWLILKCDYGQLGNRLHTHANAMAWCLEHEVNLLNLSFLPYAREFAVTSGQPAHMVAPQSSVWRLLFRFSPFLRFAERLSLSDSKLHRLGKYVAVIEKSDEGSLGEEDLRQAFQGNTAPRFLVARSWNLQCPETLKKRANEVRRRLRPHREAQDSVKRLISELRETHDVLAGLHVRRNDYRSWKGGVHFHSWERYHEWLKQLDELLRENHRHPGYLVCSDEMPPTNAFADLPVATAKRPVMTDLYALATCDYLLGPPSSFGTWASFHGAVPRMCLYPDTQIDTLSSFIPNDGS